LLKGDAYDYIQLTDNLVVNGTYGFGDIPSVYRMPGFTFFYFPFRILLNQNAAINSLIIFQFLFSIIAKYYFSLIILKKTNSKFIFLICFIILCIGSPLIFFNNILYSESLASSCLMLASYQLYNFSLTLENKRLIYSGIFIALMIFLRPFTGIVIPLLVFFIFQTNKKNIDKNLIKFCLIILFPFFIVETIWIVRNQIQFKKFIPLEKSIEGTYCESSYCQWRQLVTRCGESNVFWNPNTLGTWFASEKFLNENRIKRPENDVLPVFLFSKYLTIDSLKKARDFSNQENLEKYPKQNYELEAKRIFQMFDDTLRINHPYKYYIQSSINPVIETFYQTSSPTKNLKYPLNVLTVLINTFFSSLILLFGPIYLIIHLFIQKKTLDSFSVFFVLFVSSLVFLMDIMLRDHEGRFILIVYPIFVYFLISVLKKLKYFIAIPFLLSFLIGVLTILKMF
jgi:hypothetical protein